MEKLKKQIKELRRLQKPFKIPSEELIIPDIKPSLTFAKKTRKYIKKVKNDETQEVNKEIILKVERNVILEI